MKVTVGVLDKNGNNVVDRVLQALGDTVESQASNFGLISSRKTVFEKNVGLLRRKGIDASTVGSFASS